MCVMEMWVGESHTHTPTPTLSILTHVYRESSPLERASMEIAVLNVKVAGADGLRTEPVEQGDTGPGRYAY